MSRAVSFRFWRINIILNIYRTLHIVLSRKIIIAIIIVIELSPSPKYTYNNNIQIKQTVLYFSGTVGVFSSSIQEIELTNIKINIAASSDYRGSSILRPKVVCF